MVAPTRVSVAPSAFGSTTSPKTVSGIAVLAGDLIVVRAINENGAETFNTPTSTGLTFTAGPSVGTNGATGRCAVWTAPITSDGTISVALTTGGTTTLWWGFVVSVWRNHGGVGTTGSVNLTSGSGAPAISITTGSANSGIDWCTADFNAVDGTSRTYRSVNGAAATEDTYFRDSLHYTAYAAYDPDAGAAGAQTVGVSAPTGQAYSGVAVEILGTVGGAATPAPPAPLDPQIQWTDDFGPGDFGPSPFQDDSQFSTGAVLTPVSDSDSGTGTDSGTVSATVPGSESGTGTDTTGAVAATATGSDSGTGTEGGAVSETGSGSDTGAGSDAGTVNATVTDSDSGSGTDAGAATVTGSGSETGSGSDSGGVAATVAGSDSGTGADDGTVADITGGPTPISDSDSGAATDTGTVLDVTPPPEPPVVTGGAAYEEDTDESTVDLHRKTGHDSGVGSEAGTVVDLTPRLEPLRVILPARKVRVAVDDTDAGAAVETASIVVYAASVESGRAVESADLFDQSAEDEDEALVLRLLGVDL